MLTFLVNICIFLGHKLGLVIVLCLSLGQISQAEPWFKAVAGSKPFAVDGSFSTPAVLSAPIFLKISPPLPSFALISFADLPPESLATPVDSPVGSPPESLATPADPPAASPPESLATPADSPVSSPPESLATPADSPAEPPIDPPRVSWAFTEFPVWQEIMSGLQLLELPAIGREGQEFNMALVRIDPAHFEFSIHTVQDPAEAMSLQEWQAKYNLVAVINASMYLPDKVTSTGFLRSGEYTNNPRIVNNFGAFFLARPKDITLPGALLLDRHEDDWQDNLDKYQDAVQNYRLISAGRKVLWSPSETTHSIAAVGRDGEGRILLIHCRTPLRGVDFGALLLDLPIDIRLVMYTEGGSQAGLLLHTPKVQKIWLGQLPIDFGGIRASNGAPLPSVIGLSQK